MSGTTTEAAQSVRYWLTPAGCVATGGHTAGDGNCPTCGAPVESP